MSVESRLLTENKSARNLLYAAVGVGFISAAIWLALAGLLSATVNAVFIEKQSLGDVGGLLAAMFVLMLFRAAFMWPSDILAQHAANRVKGEMRGRLSAKLFALGPAYTRGERTGELAHAVVEGVEALDEYIASYQPARWLAALVPLLVLVVILLLDPWTVPILLFTGPILLILLALIGGRAKELTARRFNEMSWMSAHFFDMLQGLPTLKMFGRSKEQAATIEKISSQFGNTTMDVLRTAFQTSLVLEWGATAATALVAIEVSVRLMNGMIPFALALTVLLLTPEFFLPLRQLALRYHSGSAGQAAAGRIYALLDLPVASAPSRPVPELQTVTPALPARLDIRFDDVYVSYDNGQRYALNGFTLTIPQSQTVALVGATGAGKTTVASLLLRFVEPSRGKITVGGIPLNQIDALRWRTQVAWVPQQPYLFQGTVIDNLRLAKPDASIEAVVAAARAAHADEFIDRLPRGFDTPIGEHGARLSGGQRQRLAIARAFLKDAPLLLLDEPTSDLDVASEELLRDALTLFRNRTVLLIVHRLSLAYDADVIVVVDSGRVVQKGNPQELASDRGKFGQFVAAYEGLA